MSLCYSFYRKSDSDSNKPYLLPCFHSTHVNLHTNYFLIHSHLAVDDWAPFQSILQYVHLASESKKNKIKSNLIKLKEYH